ncbi:MAG: hypothetical protein H7841_03840 [Magnetospirillum sp. WYHS-4]
MTAEVKVGDVAISENQIRDLLAGYPQVARAQLVVDTDGTATLLAETAKPSMGLAPSLKAAMANLGAPIKVWFVNDGTIAADAPMVLEKR